VFDEGCLEPLNVIVNPHLIYSLKRSHGRCRINLSKEGTIKDIEFHTIDLLVLRFILEIFEIDDVL
jgi:hypothetical protein